MAEPFLWGSQIPLPAEIPSHGAPHVTALANGTFLVLGKVGTQPPYEMKAWIYNADGSIKEERNLDVPGLGYGRWSLPAVMESVLTRLVAVELPDGRIGIMATADERGSGFYAAFAALYSADLKPLGPPKPLAGLNPDGTQSNGWYRTDAILSLGNGDLAITYLPSSGTEAFIRVMGADGVLSDAISLGQALTQHDGITSMTALPGGRAIVAVRTSTGPIKGYILDTSGAGTPTLSDLFDIPISGPFNPGPLHAEVDVTVLEGNKFAVSWAEVGRAGTPNEPDPKILFQIYDMSSGQAIPLSHPTAVYANHAQAAGAGQREIVALPGGGFAIAAEVVPPNLGTAGVEIRLALFDSTGSRMHADLLVSDPATKGTTTLKELSVLADGRIVVQHSKGLQIVDPRDKAISLKGTAQNDHYIGTAFNDTFESSAGADRLEGAGGNDTYKVDNAGDRVIENANEGIDTIETSVSYVLSAHVEHLTAAGSMSIALTGNGLSNIITGNAGDNTLDGGAGADILHGGAGFDFVSFASSTVGVRTGLALGSGDGDTWTSIEGIIGSAFADTLVGNGASQLQGSGGNDIYQVRAGDVVAEAAGQGRDTVLVSTSYALQAAAEIEALKLTGLPSRTSASLTGSSTANEIVGHAGRTMIKAGSGNDKLHGGLGNDSLWGQDGRDIFVFDTRPNKSTNVDGVHDFKSADDSIWLDNKYFTMLGSGTTSKPKMFKSDMFVEGRKAQDAEDRIVYDRKTGALYYDQDGTGSKAQVKIATITNKTKLSYHDFFVI
jgi:Ca2+-binding RTX toxin-like protein